MGNCVNKDLPGSRWALEDYGDVNATVDLSDDWGHLSWDGSSDTIDFHRPVLPFGGSPYDPVDQHEERELLDSLMDWDMEI